MISKLSCPGQHHLDTNEENQDAVCDVQNDRYVVISLADGVSTCKEAKTGAELSSKALSNLLLKKGTEFFEFDNEIISELVTSHIMSELREKAIIDSKEIEEYSSTIACVLYDKKKERMLCINLGDGIIIAAKNGKCQIMMAPSNSINGCSVTTTRDVKQIISVKKIESLNLDSIVLCTDGAWKQMFDGNILRKNVSDMISKSKYGELKEYLTTRYSFDDYSFIALSKICENRRSVA